MPLKKLSPSSGKKQQTCRPVWPGYNDKHRLTIITHSIHWTKVDRQADWVNDYTVTKKMFNLCVKVHIPNYALQCQESLHGFPAVNSLSLQSKGIRGLECLFSRGFQTSRFRNVSRHGNVLSQSCLEKYCQTSRSRCETSLLASQTTCLSNSSKWTTRLAGFLSLWPKFKPWSLIEPLTCL